MKTVQIKRIVLMLTAIALIVGCIAPSAVSAKSKKALVKSVETAYWRSYDKKWGDPSLIKYEYNKFGDVISTTEGYGPWTITEYKYKYRKKSKKVYRKTVNKGKSKTVYKYNKKGVVNKYTYKNTGSYKETSNTKYTLAGRYVKYSKTKSKYGKEKPYTYESSKYKIKLKKGIPVSISKLNSEGAVTGTGTFFTKGKKKGLLKSVDYAEGSYESNLKYTYKIKKGLVTQVIQSSYYNGKLDGKRRCSFTYNKKAKTDDARYYAMIYNLMGSPLATAFWF